MQQQYPMRRAMPPPATISKCYRCGASDHLVKDCPEPPPPRQAFPPIERFCVGCSMDHLPKDCPTRQGTSTSQAPKTSLNYLDVVPSPLSSENEAETVSMNVVTRAQSRKEAETKDETKPQGVEEPKGKKRRRKRRTRSKSSKKSKGETPETEKSAERPNENIGETSEPKQPNKAHKEPSEPQPSNEDKESTKPSSGGSVIVDKVNESLQAALDAYNNRVTPLIEIPKKLQEYPNPVEEKVRLAVFQQLIQETQSTLKGPP